MEMSPLHSFQPVILASVSQLEISLPSQLCCSMRQTELSTATALTATQILAVQITPKILQN